MHLSDLQRDSILSLIEKGKQQEYLNCNKKVAKTVKEWKNKAKSDQEAYDKVYKKVIKHEHHLVTRYAHIDDSNCLRILAEVFVDELIPKKDFNTLDKFMQKEILRITGMPL